MLVFDIPFYAPTNQTWTVDLPDGVHHTFGARHDAVRFAAREVARLTAMKGLEAYLSLEGEDGKWRLFGADLKAPRH